MKLRGLKVYWDKSDWWWGYYKGPNHHYVIIPPIFCLVFRWDRKFKSIAPLNSIINTMLRQIYDEQVQKFLADNRNFINKYGDQLTVPDDLKYVTIPIKTRRNYYNPPVNPL